MNSSLIEFQNASSRLVVDAFGGAFTTFRLHDNDINPLSFCFPKEQMPANNHAGAAYQGHFACIGRWGAPSDGEMKAGLPHHGEPANIQWTIQEQHERYLSMKVLAEKEGVAMRRTITMDENLPVYAVKEMVTN